MKKQKEYPTLSTADYPSISGCTQTHTEEFQLKNPNIIYINPTFGVIFISFFILMAFLLSDEYLFAWLKPAKPIQQYI